MYSHKLKETTVYQNPINWNLCNYYSVLILTIVTPGASQNELNGNMPGFPFYRAKPSHKPK